MIKHTPGPWAVGVADSYGAAVRSVAAYEVPVGWCGVAQVMGIGGSYSIDAAEAACNARLIAAAPDLLAALRDCADYLDCIPESAAGGDDDAIRLASAARAAIAKTEEGQS